MQLQWLPSLAQDGRCALRSGAARPRRPIAAVALRALAVGIAIAMFTIVDALILRPVPFDNPNELADIQMGAERGGPGEASPPFNSVWTELQELRAGSRRMYEDSAYDRRQQPPVQAPRASFLDAGEHAPPSHPDHKSARTRSGPSSRAC